jgi:hypothetical protein
MRGIAVALCVWASLSASAPGRSEPGVQGPPSTEGDAVRRLAAASLERYRAAFSFVLADEETLQRRLPGRRVADQLEEVRRLRGELFLVFLETDRRWMAIHDVAEVDGIAVPDRESLAALLARRAAQSVFAQLAERNARYNLGRIRRNFNEPTLAQAMLDRDRNAVRFARRRVAVIGGATIVTLEFKERERSTLIRSSNGGPVYAEGELDVDAATGAVHRSVLRLEDGSIEATLETTFVRHDGLGEHVPAVFTERYADNAETIVCQTRYTNFRRFQASGRLAAP